jgi:hypothetical protein
MSETTQVTISLPEDAAVRLITLLNSQTPEGAAAREALGVISSRIVPAKEDIR